MKELLANGLLHGDVLTVTGNTVADNLAETKTLAEHVQVACRNAKITRQYYHKDAVLRHQSYSSQLVDILCVEALPHAVRAHLARMHHCATLYHTVHVCG